MDRILFSDNGTISDWSVNLGKYKSGTETFSYTTSEDAIYLGSLYPFNHRYIKMGDTVNAESVSMTLSYWDGDEFVEVANLIDETNAFANSGYVSFTPDEDKLWGYENTEDITELNSVKIYNLYWLKITFDGNLTASTILSWVGQLFSDDDDLATEYPELVRQSMLEAYENGKTDWEEQHVKAAEILVKDLVESNVIDNRNQILVKEKFKLAATSKCAEIAFRGFGDDYIDDRITARQEYDKRRKLRVYHTDLNEDGLLDKYETKIRQGFMAR